jgi:two-component system, cell cycle sensor histidine kinase and response regulator CckA
MEQDKLVDLEESINRLQEEIRTLRSALETTDGGKTMLRQGDEFARLLSISKLIVSELDLEKVFNLVAVNARELVNADLVLVPMLNEERDHYTYVAASGADADNVRGISFGAHVGMCGWVLRHKRSLLFGEKSTHWMDEKTTWEAGQQSSVLVPLFGRKGIIGGLSALGKQGGGCFTQHDLDLLTMFANQVSIAIENAQLFRQVSREIEERRQAEDSLRTSENRLHLATIAGNIGIWDWDITKNELIWDDSMYTLYGINRKDFGGAYEAWSRTLHPDDRQYVDEEIQSALRGEREYGAEFRIIRPDGIIRNIKADSQTIRDPDGRPLRMIGTNIDLTLRKQAEEKLRISEQSYKTLSENLPGIIYRVYSQENNRMQFFNNASLEITGYTDADLSAGIFCSLERLILVEDLSNVLAAVEHSVAAHEPFTVEYRLRHKDGSIRTLLEKGMPFFDTDETLLYIDGVIFDITDRKQAEEKLRESEKFIRTILNTVDEGFIVVDRDFRIQTANRAYGDQLPVPCDEIIGKHCYEVSHRTSRPCFEEGEECSVRQVFADGTPHTVLHKHAGKNNHALFVETRAFPIKDSSGQVMSAIEVISNITEKHLLEEERLKTQKLEAVGTLAGGIAHDFNNLLQGVFGYISLAKLKRDDREKSLAALEEAEKALHMSVNLTNQLLTFSKGGKPLKKIIDLIPVIENAAKFALSGSRTDYRVVADDDLWQVDADGGQISQVIHNIVLNADQAMPEGGLVEITARNVHAQGRNLPQGLPQGTYVEITIRDSGVGIPKQYLAKIFDPYFTTKEKGSGLGLATSYSIITNHKGLIEVKSEMGKGTTFSIYLPATTAIRAKVQNNSATAATAGRAWRVLVMDDEQVVRDISVALITELGHRVELAVHGKEALDKFLTAKRSGDPFDVVILDLTIRGGMGGAETLQRLKEIDPGVKTVVSSGYSDDSLIAGYQEQGFKAVLKKPYNVKELQEVLNKLLNS